MLLKKTVIIRLLVFLLLPTACIDPISFPTGEQAEARLTVSGFISDDKGPYLVTLSRSANFSNSAEKEGYNIPVVDAIVKIIDDKGNEELLEEATTVEIVWEDRGHFDSAAVAKTIRKKGVYTTTCNFKGMAGSRYHVYIKTSNGSEYMSVPETLKKSTAIDSVYFVYESHQQLNNLFNIEDNKVFQYYADINFGEGDSYYMFDWEGTFLLKTWLRELPLCYVTAQKRFDFNLISSDDFTTQKIVAHPLNFMPPSFRQSIKYSYNLKQYAINENAYRFFKLIKNQISSTGSIFDPLPTKISGNIYNINDSEELVFGYFGAYGVSSKRTYINRIDLPRNYNKDTILPCFTLAKPAKPLYCFDCLFYSEGTRTKPDFWE